MKMPKIEYFVLRKFCKICGKNPCYPKGKRVDGITPKYGMICGGCRDRETRRKKGILPKVRKIKPVKGIICEECGFKALHKCQIDLHHKDKNPKNNSPDNLQSLCANCHRLITCINNHYGQPKKARNCQIQ